VLRTLVSANPLTPLVGASRAGLIGVAPPEPLAVAAAVAAGVALVVIGAAALDRWRYTIADLL
jgi:ABC-type polysaccharide/polyol phosphate export permease